MKLKIKGLGAFFAVTALIFSAAASAQTGARSYAVMSLVGNAMHIHAVRHEVGTRTPGEMRHVLDIAEPLFDAAALKAAQASIRQIQPGARTVLLMTQDAGLYKAQNAMFEMPDANKADRDYLIGLLKPHDVSHLVLVTKQRGHAYFKLTNGSLGTGLLEGLGFYIDDTTRLRNTDSRDSSSGMLGPFSYIKIRLLDARTLAVVGEIKATKSSIITRPSVEPSAMDIWTSLPSAEKAGYINALLAEAVTEALAPLLSE